MVGHILWMEASVQIHAKIEFMKAGRLLAILDMSPSTTSKGPSTTTKGVTLCVTPSTYTLSWGLVLTLNSNYTRHTPNASNDLDTLWGCQWMQRPFGHSIRTPYMSVILPNRMDQAAERTYNPRLCMYTKNYSIIILSKITFTYEPL